MADDPISLEDKFQARIAQWDFTPDGDDAAMKAAYLEDVYGRLTTGEITERDARNYLAAGAEYFNRGCVLDITEDEAAPNFPLEIYPSWVQAYCIELAAACEVPSSVAGFTLLGMLGAAYGTHLEVMFKPGYVRYCHDYFFLVADVSVGKSGVFSYLSKPLYEIQRSLRAHVRPPDGDRKKTSPPPQVVISDCTPEPMIDIQNANDGAIAHISADTPLFAQLSITGQKPWPLAPFCSSHTGEPYHVHRITRGSNEVECARLAAVAGTQPDTLKQVHARPQIETSGLFARCTFYVVPRLTVDDLSPGDPAVSEHLQTRFTEVVTSLGLHYRNGEHAPCRFDRAAARARIDWIDSMRPRYKLQSGDLHAHAGHCAKLEEKVGRWAAVLHVLHHADKGTGAGVLSIADWERALSLYEFGFAHHKQAQALVYQGPAAALTDALETFCCRHSGKTVTERLMKKNCRPYERASESARKEAIASIEAKGLGKWVPNLNRGAGRPSPGLEVF